MIKNVQLTQVCPKNTRLTLFKSGVARTAYGEVGEFSLEIEHGAVIIERHYLPRGKYLEVGLASVSLGSGILSPAELIGNNITECPASECNGRRCIIKDILYQRVSREVAASYGINPLHPCVNSKL